jgi:glycine cleavage system aminomethyltransferase T
VGWVTSAVRSPALGAAIGLGYVRREHLAPGEVVHIEAEGGSLRAQIAELPMVRPA